MVPVWKEVHHEAPPAFPLDSGARSRPRLRVAGAGPPNALPDIFGAPEPRAFFFIQSEGDALGVVIPGGDMLPYETFEDVYIRLNGVMGGMMSETKPYRDCARTTYFQFKTHNPEQLVLHHERGVWRNAKHCTFPNFNDSPCEHPHGAPYPCTCQSNGSEEFSAGHWLYCEGSRVISNVSLAQGESQTVIHVEDPGLFRTDVAGNTEHGCSWNDELVLVELGDDGRPDWSKAEQVRLVAKDDSAGTLTVERGYAGTPRRSFPANRTTAAAHVSFGPSAADILAGQLMEWFGTGGVNVLDLGLYRFYEQVRGAIPAEKILLVDAGAGGSFRNINGVESEGFPKHIDCGMDTWSSGLNLLLFARARSPVFVRNFTVYKDVDALAREYQNGAVLVNPAASAHDFDLDRLLPLRHFRRIDGIYHRSVNDGQPLSHTVTLPPMDALFLVKTDP